MKEDSKKIDKITRYLLNCFGFNGGRYLILNKSIDELIELTEINKNNLPNNFYDLVRDRWKEIIKNHH